MNIAFRVDASTQIGTGHLMRCLTLADALAARGAYTRFVCRYIPDILIKLIQAKSHHLRLLQQSPKSAQSDKGELAHSHWLETSQTQDAQECLQLLSDKTWDWVIVDHYALDSRWEALIRTVANSIMVIDDLADRHHICDVLLDQNFYFDVETRYLGKVPSRCQLLLGPRYAMLREEFRLLHHQVKPRVSVVKRVLVFFGGVDANNFTARAIAALSGIKSGSLSVDVVIGAQHPYKQQIESACNSHGFSCHVQTTKIAELMAAADLAIGAGGASTWERCCLGLPTLAFSLAANQKRLTEDAAAQLLLYSPDLDNPDTKYIEIHLKALLENTRIRSIISANGLRTVDGLGVSRVIRRLDNNYVSIRRATAEDAIKLFEWRNHSSIRAVSKHKDIIDWETHQKWFDSVLADTNRELLIGFRSSEHIGVVRFDISGEVAEVSIYLVPGIKNAGTELLQSAENWLIANYPAIRRLNAEVNGNNRASTNLFITRGYKLASISYQKEVAS